MIRASAVGVAVCLAIVCLSLAGCSDGGDQSSDSVTSTTTATTLGEVGDPPIVEEIDDAIAALEAELGGPQEYFEINATARLVNLFVALDQGTSVQPWVYFDGELTSDEPAAAEGGVLRAADLTFDAATILATLQSELPSATIESFYIQGNGLGAVQYGALVTTSQGGAIDVQLGANGQILGTEPLN